MPDRLTSHALSHELYLRALGATALVAWLSLHIQIDGLFGPDGLLPMALRIEAFESRDGASAFWQSPSLLYVVGGSSGAMHALIITGELAALGMIFGIATGPLALLSYVLYLSFVSLGWPFLPLQWDTLLLEALVVGALLGRWRSPRATLPLKPPGMLARIVGYALVTRLLFASGLMKVLSGDPTWLDGTAMTFHHWSQPLPSPLAPYLHALPSWVHAIETYATLAIEIGAPLLVLAGVRGRRAFAAITVVLMALISLSGSYGFFNLLTVVLCIPLLDDAALLRVMPNALRPLGLPSSLPPAETPGGSALLLAYLTCAAIQLVTSLGAPVPTALEGVYLALYRTHVAGQYGLFARMTTDRPELLFEGSSDGVEWEPYDFWYKPGDPSRSPSFCAPHMPRVDWMLWFAAIPEPPEHGAAELDPWVAHIAQGLLQDRPETRALFRSLPLHGGRPDYLRLVRARYVFADEGSDAWRVEDRHIVRTWRRR
jgi:uncharacterized membrane protein YphA (DoxX/SURF4 family)